MIKSEYIRIGSDRGGEVEIVLRPDRFGKTGSKSVVFRTPAGAEFKLDHPKDVSLCSLNRWLRCWGCSTSLLTTPRARLARLPRRRASARAVVGCWRFSRVQGVA